MATLRWVPRWHLSWCINFIHPNTLIASVQTNPRKKIITPKLPPLWMVIKNKFDWSRIDHWIFNFAIIELVTEFFLSPTFNHHTWQPKIFNHQILVTIINNQIFFNLLEKKLKVPPKTFHCFIDSDHWFND
jgi:hypothetical protein